jgi:hypothetical protein
MSRDLPPPPPRKASGAKYALSQGRQQRRNLQARPPRHRKTGGLRSPAWARSASRLLSSRSAPSSPNQRSSDYRNALAALEPQPGNYVSPRTTDYVRTSVVELAARSEQAERSL